MRSLPRPRSSGNSAILVKFSAVANHLKADYDYLSSQNYVGALSKNNIGNFLCGSKTYMIFL